MTEQQAQTPQKQAKRRGDFKSMVIIFVTMFLLTTANVLYTNQQAHKFCALMVTLDESYSQFKPTSSAGRKVAANVHELRKSLGCKGK